MKIINLLNESSSNDKIDLAIKFATDAHAEQKRKYTFEPYVTHCFTVAETVASNNGTSDMIIAALLHDTIEDTNTTLSDIKSLFGNQIADLVYWLTDTAELKDGNRFHRKEMSRKRLSQAPKNAQLIKLADRLSNIESIIQHDPKFAKVYIDETLLLLQALTKVKNTSMWKKLKKICSIEKTKTNN